jgi:hypothetical protein
LLKQRVHAFVLCCQLQVKQALIVDRCEERHAISILISVCEESLLSRVPYLFTDTVCTAKRDLALTLPQMRLDFNHIKIRFGLSCKQATRLVVEAAFCPRGVQTSRKYGVRIVTSFLIQTFALQQRFEFVRQGLSRHERGEVLCLGARAELDHWGLFQRQKAERLCLNSRQVEFFVV